MIASIFAKSTRSNRDKKYRQRCDSQSSEYVYYVMPLQNHDSQNEQSAITEDYKRDYAPPAEEPGCDQGLRDMQGREGHIVRKGGR